MNQIPSEGEFCGECPISRDGWKCKYFDIYFQKGSIALGLLRLPICLKERPQIITTGKEGKENERNL